MLSNYGNGERKRQNLDLNLGLSDFRSCPPLRILHPAMRKAIKKRQR